MDFVVKKELASGTTWQHITTMVAIFAQPKVTQRSKSSNVVSPIMNIMNILMVIWYWVIINIKLSGWWLPIELQWITMNLTFSQEHPHLSRGWSLSPAAYLQRSLRILWSQAWLSLLMMENVEFAICGIWSSRLLSIHKLKLFLFPPRPSFSPESGGRVNPRMAIEEIRRHGTIRLEK